jgi:glycine oxidase
MWRSEESFERNMKISIIGAGVAGLTCAFEFANRGCKVEVVEQNATAGLGCSWYAGGMLAPWCEREAAEPLIETLGVESIAFWKKNFDGTRSCGTLVIAPSRDQPELKRFARRTSESEWIGPEVIAELEPDLAGRFSRALYFQHEAHIDPRLALVALRARLEQEFNVAIRFNETATIRDRNVDWTIDCRGLVARDLLPDLRGVKGEMLVLRTREVALSRPVRILHPRIPAYIVPRADGLFMVGATMIESDEFTRVTARSVIELLNAAYAVHPAFGEAEVVEIGSGVRPAFPNNLPRIRRSGHVLRVNGLFRHGFLLAPALARMAAAIAIDGAHFTEVMDENQSERRSA